MQEEPGTSLPTCPEEKIRGGSKRQSLASNPSTTYPGDVSKEEVGSCTREVAKATTTKIKKQIQEAIKQRRMEVLS